MNLEAMNHLELFQNLGFPVLLGTSRKSMIGLALDLPVDQRVEGTLATSVIGVMKGDVYKRQKQDSVTDYLHKVTRYLAEYCRERGITCVVTGDIRNLSLIHISFVYVSSCCC